MKLLNSKNPYKKIKRLGLKALTIPLLLIFLLGTTNFIPNSALAAQEKKKTKIDKILTNLLDKNFIECMNPTLCAVLYIPYYNIWIFVWGFRHPALLIETVNKPGVSLIWGDVLGDSLKIGKTKLLSGGTTTPSIGNMQYNEVHIFGLDYSPIKVCSGGSGGGLDMSEMMEKMQELLGGEEKEEKTGAHVVLARPKWNIMKNPLGDYCVSDRLQLVYPTSSGPFKPGQGTSKWAPKSVSKESLGGDFAYVYWRGAACIQIKTSSSSSEGSGGGGGGGMGGFGGGQGYGAGAGAGKGKGEKKGLSWPRVVQYMITALTTVSQYGSKDQQTAGTAVGTAHGGYKTYETGKNLGFFGGAGKGGGRFFDKEEKGKGEGDKGVEGEAETGAGIGAEAGGEGGGGEAGTVSKALEKITIPYICGGSGSGGGSGGGMSFCVMGKATDDILNFYYLSELDCIEWRFALVERIKRLYQKVAGLGEWFEGGEKGGGGKKEGEVDTTGQTPETAGYQAERYSVRGKNESEEEGWESGGWLSGVMEKIGCEFYASEKISKGGKCIGRWGPLNPRRGHYIHHNPYISSALTMWRAIDIMFMEKEKEETGIGAGAGGAGAGGGATGAAGGMGK